MEGFQQNSTDGEIVFDLAIIGGGINGAGIALDAALRGLSVVLLEKDDFGSHTTSASTKLIHGGLRYLEYFEFGLVRESLRERERLLHNAPHLAWPLKLNVPVYEHSSRGPLMIKAGMLLYDVLSYDKSLPAHSFHYARKNGKTGKLDKGINTNGLKAMASYYDCQVGFPERLCMEIVLSARKEGAITLNYHEVLSVQDEAGLKILGVRDKFGQKDFTVRARVVVNAGGIFVDKINQRISQNIPRRMGGTKGSHILIHKFENGPQNAYYVEAIQDGRPFFIIPWRNFYLVGTTDIYYDGELDRIVATEKEVEYLLYELNNLFPGRNFNKKDVIYTYSGVRPLPYEPGKKENQVTRSHIVFDHSKQGGPDNLLSIIGGKLTTYRSLAEECVDLACKKLNRRLKCQTENYALIGGRDYRFSPKETDALADEYAAKYNVERKSVVHLIRFYGSRFKDVLLLTKKYPGLNKRICIHNQDIFAQVAYAVLFEQARTIEDIMIRRTAIGTSACLGLDCVEGVVEVAGRFLDWQANDRRRIADQYKKYIYENYKKPLEN